MKKVIITGASSGIGRGLAEEFHRDGYMVGITARRVELLEELKRELGGNVFIKEMDLRDIEGSVKGFHELIDEMGGLDTAVLNSGVGFSGEDLVYSNEKHTIDVNVTGFVALAVESYNYFKDKGEGHIVGISSIASIRGRDEAPAYNASKAFMKSYMEGLRHKSVKYKRGITVTDIRPGFVDTPLVKNPRAFWKAPVEKACRQIYRAIKKKKKSIYITKRWNLIAWLIHLLPDFIYNRI